MFRALMFHRQAAQNCIKQNIRQFCCMQEMETLTDDLYSCVVPDDGPIKGAQLKELVCCNIIPILIKLSAFVGLI
jgi:hypothetical protein